MGVTNPTRGGPKPSEQFVHQQQALTRGPSEEGTYSWREPTRKGKTASRAGNPVVPRSRDHGPLLKPTVLRGNPMELLGERV